MKMKKYERKNSRKITDALAVALVVVILAAGSLFLTPQNMMYARAAGRPVAISSCMVSGGGMPDYCRQCTGQR